MSCSVCKFSEEHGFIDPKLRLAWHCSDGCHASGKGHSELHCAGFNGSGCHRTFGSEAAFNAHQTEKGCRDPISLKTKAGERRFKAIMRGELMVWVKNDTSGTERFETYRDRSEPPGPEDNPEPKKKRSVAAERSHVYRSRLSA